MALRAVVCKIPLRHDTRQHRRQPRGKQPTGAHHHDGGSSTTPDWRGSSPEGIGRVRAARGRSRPSATRDTVEAPLVGSCVRHDSSLTSDEGFAKDAWGSRVSPMTVRRSAGAGASGASPRELSPRASQAWVHHAPAPATEAVSFAGHTAPNAPPLASHACGIA